MPASQTPATARRRTVSMVAVPLLTLFLVMLGLGGQPALAESLASCSIVHGSGTMQLVTTGEVPTPDYGQSLLYQVWGGIDTSGCTAGAMHIVGYSTSTNWPSTPGTCDVSVPAEPGGSFMGCYGLYGYSGVAVGGYYNPFTIKAVITAVGANGSEATYSPTCSGIITHYPQTIACTI